MLKIILTDGSQFELALNEGPFRDFLLRAYKHLQHIDVPQNTKSELVFTKSQQNHFIQVRQNSCHDIIQLGKKFLNIDIINEKLSTQDYLNDLHRYYENNYNKTTYDKTWLKFHDLIHKIELLNMPIQKITNILCSYLIDYEDLDGHLHYDVTDRTILEESVTDFEKGHCYLIWQELGKTPMQYWRDGYDSMDVEHFLNVAKPITHLKPTLCIALEDFEYKIDQEELDQFNKWFEPLKSQWMDYYNIDKIYPNEIQSMNHFHQGPKFKIGHLNNFEEFNQKLRNGIIPIRVTL